MPDLNPNSPSRYQLLRARTPLNLRNREESNRETLSNLWDRGNFNGSGGEGSRANSPIPGSPTGVSEAFLRRDIFGNND